MAEDKKAREQAEVIKSNATKLLEMLMKIAPVPKGVQDGYKLSKDTIKVLSNPDSATAGLTLDSAFDDNIKRLGVIAASLLKELGELSDKNENWWIASSGANLLSVGDSTKALKILEKQRASLLALRGACEALRTLTEVSFLATIADVKGLAKTFMPSVPIFDRRGANKAKDDFEECIRKIDYVLKKIELAFRGVADMNKVVDRFLILLNSQDQRSAVKSIQQGIAKPSE
jgi:hypothetical protein